MNIKTLVISTLSKMPYLESIYERIMPIRSVNLENGHNLLFASNNSLVKYRIETFFSKEPQTLQWIDAFDKNAILFDIGANIGLYSLYAGNLGLKVYSFEPDSLNFAVLNRNIHFNKLSNSVIAYNVALSNTETMGQIFTSQFMSGGSFHQIDQKLQKDASHLQGVVIQTLDKVAELLNVSINYLKIDVDGNEKNILLGADKVLSSPELKSILIEVEKIDDDENNELVLILKKYGFKINEKHYLNDAKTTANYILTKN
ncbi:MAG: FkbM family methyltransferase [Bacteriovorax sp.]|nr:FkbM family methyltransferase [Bacteriovorax sp.]